MFAELKASSLPQPRRSPPILPYVVAVIGVAIALAGTLLIGPLKDNKSLTLFLAASGATILIAGFRAGILALILSVVIAGVFVFQMHEIPDKFHENLIRLAIFTVSALLLCSLFIARERAEEQANRNQDRLRAVMEATKTGAWEYNLMTGEFWWSKTLEHIFGRAPGSFSETYEGFVAYIHPEDKDFVNRALTQTLEDGVDYEIEHRIVRPDNEVRWVLTRGRIFHNNNKVAERIIGVATDITARKVRESKPADSVGV